MNTALASIEDTAIGAKVTVNYSPYVSHMAKKHFHYDCKLKDNDDVIIIGSFDGAEHSRNTNNSTSISSFSSQMITSSMLNSGVIKAGSNTNIYSWQ